MKGEPPTSWSTYIHSFHVSQVDNNNDPNKSTSLLDASKKETWTALLEKQEKKAKEEVKTATE